MPNTLKGIEGKLKRTDENIENLKFEITSLFQGGKYPVMPKLGTKEHLEALDYYKCLDFPPRFSVLAGEIVHHLRSCLDHIVWGLSPNHTFSEARFIEFPILETRPTPKNQFTKYDRKIQGITSATALKCISDLQPYNRLDPFDDPLAVIHRLDIADKHQELLRLDSTGYINIPNAPPHIAVQLMRYLSGRYGTFTPEFISEFNKYCEVTPQIAFKQFGRRKIQAVIPGLTQLTNYIKGVVGLFLDEF